VIVRKFFAAALAAVLLGAAPAGPLAFSAPAGDRPAGSPDPAHPFNVILPNGRIVAPVGASVVVGMNALGVALSPDGRFAIVSNDSERQEGAHPSMDQRIEGAYSLAVVDTKTMQVVDVFHAADQKFFVGIVAVRDPADATRTIVLASGGSTNVVHFFDLSSTGALTEEPGSVSMPAPIDGRFADQNHAFPATIAMSSDGRTAYVANNLANTVAAIDVARRQLLHAAPVGFFPYGAAVANKRVYVTNEGLMRYGVLPRPVTAPAFANVAADPQKASSLSSIATSIGGDVIANAAAATVRLDQQPDGNAVVGGAHPSAIVTSPDGRFAYICMGNVDRVDVVALTGVPHVVGGLSLQLYSGWPYGTQPDAIARSKDGTRLYVALAGVNAVAVLDSTNPVKLHRLGLIPTGWYPSALAVSADGHYLYVANAKGLGQMPGFEGEAPYKTSSSGQILQSSGDSNTIWATLQRVDLWSVPLESVTLSALRYTRLAAAAKANPIVPPIRSLRASSVIKHVVFILEENKTFDSMLGDLQDANGQQRGNGDPSLVSFGQSVTPNLHALARTFGLADNLYADADESDAGHQFATGGVATIYTEKTLLNKGGRAPLVNKNEDPEDYPRAGYIFNNLERASRSYRDYGDLVRLSGYDEGNAQDPTIDDPNFRGVNDQNAVTSGLGGLYSLDVPALGALGDHIDLNYPGWNLHIRDVRRAKEFLRDIDPYVKADRLPAFTYIWLPADHGGYGPNIPALPEEVADGDRALGSIVDYFSHTPQWQSTAIFITPDDAQSTRDHVSEHRTYAIVVSPYAKRGYVGHHHLSTVSLLKTEEELLGLPPLALNDLLASDLADFFNPTPDPTPFDAIAVPTQTASLEGRRIQALLGRTDQSAPDADVERSARLIGLSREADQLALRRGALTPPAYAQAQDALYQAALRVVTTPANDKK
jgi:DNA-binding beta-propeller fold protein YncE